MEYIRRSWWITRGGWIESQCENWEMWKYGNVEMSS